MNVWGASLIVLLLATSVAADTTRVIINRNETTATLYVSAPLEHASHLVSARNAQIGVAKTAKLSPLKANGPNGKIVFEPMSVVFHPETSSVPFETPWDASLASSICTEPNLDQIAHPETLYVYAGYVAHGIDGLAGFSVELPGAAPEIILADFAEGRAVGEPHPTERLEVPAVSNGFWARLRGH